MLVFECRTKSRPFLMVSAAALCACLRWMRGCWGFWVGGYCGTIISPYQHRVTVVGRPFKRFSFPCMTKSEISTAFSPTTFHFCYNLMFHQFVRATNVNYPGSGYLALTNPKWRDFCSSILRQATINCTIFWSHPNNRNGAAQQQGTAKAPVSWWCSGEVMFATKNSVMVRAHVGDFALSVCPHFLE